LYNSVKRENTWSSLRKLKVPEYLVVKVKFMYSDFTGYVETTVGRSEWFKTSSGVSQRTKRKPILINALFMIIRICMSRIFVLSLF
jgi:hypothetical protein